MAAKEYRINIGSKKYKVMANSAQQAARRVEKLHAKNTRVINQRNNVSNVTRKSVADAPGIAVAALPGSKIRVGNAGREWGTPAQRAALKKAQKASAAKRRKG